jgi:hypothetical protein
MIKKGVRHMINIRRIRWFYENFGMASAVKSAAIDLVALLGFAGYCLTLPFQFFWILWRGVK